LRSADEARLVQSLLDEGRNHSEIARATGIPRSTVRDWAARGPRRLDNNRKIDPSNVPRCDYAYVLGLYLGDGHIVRLPRTFRLSIYMDSRYPAIIAEVRRALASVLYPNKAAIQRPRRVNMAIVRTHSNSLPTLFPQHGPGPKHMRPIALADWQQAIVEEHPDLFVRGLIQSDGCRVMNKVWGGKYAYPRYFFTQVSDDIRRLFCDACDRLGVDYRLSNWKTVSVAKAGSVARLDEFVGPKR
jgi:hypothetical protein